MTAQVSPILWPTIFLATLVFAIWFVLIRQRLHHIARQAPKRSDFADGESVARYFRPVERPAQNLANLFEMPVLYFAVVPLLIQTGYATGVQAALAWAFVILRALHSVVHVGPNTVQTRFRIYLGSCVALSGMWLGFGIDLLTGIGRPA